MKGCNQVRFSERGSQLLETAAVLPLLLLLTFAVADFSGLFYGYLALENGVSQATRFAVTGQVQDNPATTGPPSTDEQIMAIKNAMESATPTLDASKFVYLFQYYSDTSEDWQPGVGGPNDPVKVIINYDWPLMTPLIGAFFLGGSINLEVSSTMKNEPYPLQY